jgi:hypothetical protein
VVRFQFVGKVATLPRVSEIPHRSLQRKISGIWRSPVNFLRESLVGNFQYPNLEGETQFEVPETGLTRTLRECVAVRLDRQQTCDPHLGQSRAADYIQCNTFRCSEAYDARLDCRQSVVRQQDGRDAEA